MDEVNRFFNETYPRIWKEAYQLGEKARTDGLPKECNLSDEQFMTPSGDILKVYRSAWEQGYDIDNVLDTFRKVEDYLGSLPTRDIRESDDIWIEMTTRYDPDQT